MIVRNNPTLNDETLYLTIVDFINTNNKCPEIIDLMYALNIRNSEIIKNHLVELRKKELIIYNENKYRWIKLKKKHS